MAQISASRIFSAEFSADIFTANFSAEPNFLNEQFMILQ